MNEAYAIGLVASLRDQPRGGPLDEPYYAALEVLGLLGSSAVAPTLALALEHGVPPFANEQWIEKACTALQSHPATARLMIRVSELPGFALAAASINSVKTGPKTRRIWLEHAFWKARCKALFRIKDAIERAQAACSVWHSIETASIPVDEEPWSYATPLSLPEGPRDWAALAKPYGGLIELALPASVEEGANAACADLRVWCRGVLAARGEPSPPEHQFPAGLVIKPERRAGVVAAEEEILERVKAKLGSLPGS